MGVVQQIGDGANGRLRGRGQLRQAFVNILLNAVEASKRGDTLRRAGDETAAKTHDTMYMQMANPAALPSPPRVVPDARSLFLGVTYTLAPLPAQPIDPRPGFPVWTDDFNNLLTVLKR